ncbi:beta strand repeat-containing protein [Lacipirellula sp.]|uniref:beta strand repeat-containing protein n=1 Tax=Lacipirellula sp. TaxID=2691419 RepID=UPI003D096C58
MAPYGISTARFLLACLSLAVASQVAHAQYVFVPNGTATPNWNGGNRWTVGGSPTGAVFPNAMDAAAEVNVPFFTTDGTLGTNVPGGITVGSLKIINADSNLSTSIGGGTPGTLTFQVSSGSASYTETAGVGNGATTVRPVIVLLSNLVVTQDNVDSDALNAGTVFTNKINAAAGITFTKAGNSNLSINNTTALGAGEGFFGSYVINQGAMRFISNTLLTNAESFTINAGGQLQIGAAVTDINLGAGATLKLNGTGVVGGPSNNDGALRFQLNTGVTTNFNSPIELQSAANITVNNSDSTAVAKLTKAISGTGGLTKTGNGDLYLTGTDSNTHAGGTGVSAGMLFLNKTGGATAVPGTLSIGGTSVVVLQQDHQIADAALIRFTSTTGQGTIRLGTNRQEAVGGLLSTNAGAGVIESNSLQADSLSTLTVNAVMTSRFEGVIRDSGNTATIPGKLALAKSGVESLELTNANLYSGGTTVSGGVLLVNNTTGSGVGTGALTVNNGGIIGGRGFIGTGAAPVGVSVAGGVIAPGDAAPGMLTMNGNVTLDAASSITFDISGAVSGAEYDQLVVNNDLNLGGSTLNFSLGAFVPTGIESFTLISKESEGAITGVFSNYSEGAAVNLAGVSYLLSYTGGSGNDVVLTLNTSTPTLNADFNDDNVVDGRDFLIWQRGFGAPGGLIQGDANGDNVVNDADLAVWKDQFGQAAAQPAVGAVPEPASLALIASAVGGLLLAQRRRRLS